MSNGKVMLFIVEGPSDEIALGAALKRIFKNKHVYVHVVHGDITSDKDVSSDNIVKRVNELIKGVIDKEHFLPTNIQRVIHIIDTDGSWIDDSCITPLNPETDPIVLDHHGNIRPVYNTTGIHTDNINGIIERNSRKKANVMVLCSRGKISRYPYSIYYMSCNLDHVLYDKLNLTDDEKEFYADSFDDKYSDDTDAFLKYMCESDFSVNKPYGESWKFIQKGLNSVSRYTNLCDLLKQEMPDCQ